MGSNPGGFMNTSQFVTSRLALTVGLLLSAQALAQTAPAAPMQAAPAQQVAPAPAYAPAAAPAPPRAAPMTPGPAPSYVFIDPATGQPMPTVSYSPMLRQRPSELPYREGAPVPRGYVVEEYHPRGLIIGGAVTLGVLYAISLSVASSNDFNTANGWLAVPVIGPFGWLAARKSPTCNNNSIYVSTCNNDDSGNRTMVVLDGMGQIAGATMLIAGLAITRKHLLFVNPDETVVAPYASSTSAGVNVLGRF